MKLKTLQKHFDTLNREVFKGILPYVKLNITYKERDYYGICNTYYSGKTGFQYKTRIILCDYNIDIYPEPEKEYIRVLLHEMVHLWQAVKYNNSRLFKSIELHPKELFNSFGELAYLKGLCYNSDLLGEYYEQ